MVCSSYNSRATKSRTQAYRRGHNVRPSYACMVRSSQSGPYSPEPHKVWILQRVCKKMDTARAVCLGSLGGTKIGRKAHAMRGLRICFIVLARPLLLFGQQSKGETVLTWCEDSRQFACVEDGHGQSSALGISGGEEVGVPVLNLVPQVISGRQEVWRCNAGTCLCMYIPSVRPDSKLCHVEVWQGPRDITCESLRRHLINFSGCPLLMVC